MCDNDLKYLYYFMEINGQFLTAKFVLMINKTVEFKIFMYYHEN